MFESLGRNLTRSLIFFPLTKPSKICILLNEIFDIWFAILSKPDSLWAESNIIKGLTPIKDHLPNKSVFKFIFSIPLLIISSFRLLILRALHVWILVWIFLFK